MTPSVRPSVRPFSVVLRSSFVHISYERTFVLFVSQVVQESVSSCGTRKLLVRLEDGLEVETVVIPCLSGSRCVAFRARASTDERVQSLPA